MPLPSTKPGSSQAGAPGCPGRGSRHVSGMAADRALSGAVGLCPEDAGIGLAGPHSGNPGGTAAGGAGGSVGGG